jgi:hypothetical protein
MDGKAGQPVVIEDRRSPGNCPESMAERPPTQMVLPDLGFVW